VTRGAVAYAAAGRVARGGGWRHARSDVGGAWKLCVVILVRSVVWC
jgi:hypothetical protein